MLKNLSNLKYSFLKDKSKKEAKLLKLNCQKINKLTKWKPVYSFKESVESTTLWYKFLQQ